MHSYRVDGPYAVSIANIGTCRFVDAGGFWVVGDPIAPRKGVYVFCLGPSLTSLKPWYVGKTHGVKGFRAEAFTNDKLLKYAKALAAAPASHQAYMFFVSREFKGKVNESEIKRLETELIGQAFSVNSSLLNSHNIPGLPMYGIQGVIRSGIGKPSTAANMFAVSLNF